MSRRRYDEEDDLADYQEKREKRARSVFKVLVAIAVLVGVASLAFWIGAAVDYNINVWPEYQKNVRGHVENAYYAMEPELIMEELTLAKQGMIDVGLNESDYGSYFNYGKTPDWSMHYQFQLIDSVIGRAQNIIDWRENNTNATTQLGDVYQQKMSSLKSFIKDNDGWVDDIAEKAWICKCHTFYNFFIAYMIGNAVIVVGFIAIAVFQSIRIDNM